jgi:NAD(P)-dependent dehydrogenase (short-subunit alcohol dehydrogenase family)
MQKDKVAVIYGAGGAIGGAVARTFAREGAKVFLSGRTPPSKRGETYDRYGYVRGSNFSA